MTDPDRQFQQQGHKLPPAPRLETVGRDSRVPCSNPFLMLLCTSSEFLKEGESEGLGSHP